MCGITAEPSSTALVGPPMQKRAILFDIDGTLVDSNDAHVEAWHQAFAAEGHAFSRTEIHAQVGKGSDNLVPSLLPNVSAEIQKRIAEVEGEIFRRDFMPRSSPSRARAKSSRRWWNAGTPWSWHRPLLAPKSTIMSTCWMPTD
jgi:hypothetical protein